MLFLGTISKLILPFSNDILIEFINWIICSNYHSSNSCRWGICFLNVYELLCDILLTANLLMYFLVSKIQILFFFPKGLYKLVEGCKSFTNVHSLFMFLFSLEVLVNALKDHKEIAFLPLSILLHSKIPD